MYEIDFKRLSGTSRLFLDFINCSGSACEFFGGDFRKIESYRQTAVQLDKYTFDRVKVASIIKDAASSFRLSDLTRSNIEKLTLPDSLCVFAGQQTGLLLGPMYTVLKALTAYKLARKLESELGRPVIPCFWIATDDHDFDEIKSAALLSRDGDCNTIVYEPKERNQGAPISALNFESEIISFVDTVDESLIDTEFKKSIIAALRTHYIPGGSISGSFVELFEQLMGQYGIVPVDPNYPGLKAQFHTVFEREIESHDKLFGIFENQSRKLIEHGYHRQVHKSSEILNLFYNDGIRRNIIAADHGFSFDGHHGSISKMELLKMLAENPGRFSPSVILRPIAQCAAFPVISQIVGPSEAAYFAQIKPLYEFHEVPWPVIFPRQFATLIEPHISKIIHKLSIDFAGLVNDKEFEIGRVISANFPSETVKRAESLKNDIEKPLTDLAESLKESDLESYQAIEHVRKKIDHELNHLSKKLIQAHKKKNDDARQRILKAANFLLPSGNYQERVISPIYFVNKFGPDIIDMIERKLDIESTGHQLLEIDI